VKIFTDYASGASTNRPELSRCLDFLLPGNVLTVWRIDAARTLHAGGQSMTQIAKNFGVSRATVSRALSATRATATPV